MSDDKIYDDLCKIYEELKAALKEPEPPKSHIDDLAPTEVRKLLKNEPDFTRSIVKPLGRRRNGNFMLGVILLILITPHSILLIAIRAPTEISQPHPPTVKVTLPYVR